MLAFRELNRAAWRLEWFAQGLLDDADRAEWQESMRAFRQAFNDVHEHARRDLDVAGQYVPRDLDPCPARTLRHRRERPISLAEA